MRGGKCVKKNKKTTVVSLTSSLVVCILLSSAVSAKDCSFPLENSWRYSNGELNENNRISLFSTVTPWSKQNSVFVNDVGEEIDGAVLKGIDVSHHQGTIDWGKVKETDVDFAIIRCGFGDDLTKYDDSQWFNNANACTQLGIPFGVYIYSYAASIEEAESEAAHVLRLIDGYDLSFPVYLDLEDNTVGACSNELIGDMAEAFCGIIKNAGYDVGIYANKYWWTTKLTDSAFDDGSLYKWVAQYNSTCTYNGGYSMWQATSSGTTDGISGNVDVNFWFGEIPYSDNIDYSYPNTYVNSGNLKDDIVGVAETQIGYTELSDAGVPVIDSEIPCFTKYGERYGNPYGHWCAFFVMWCAEQADIPTSIVCKSVNCGNCEYFAQWFKSNNRWEDENYTAKKGDIVFFDFDNDGKSNHVGIVVAANENAVITVEGNTGGVNGYLVAENSRNSGILGYGIPNYDLIEKLNGISAVRQTAYMLPNVQSATVWETWENDELQVLCEDGDYYLVLYPYMYTGKFVAAYVPKDTVSVNSSVLTSDVFYSINESGTVIDTTAVYHNASTDDLMNGTTNYNVRSILAGGESVSVLFEDGDFYFIRTESVSGYISKTAVTLNTCTSAMLGDINNDLKVDSADAGLILRYDVGLINLSGEQLQCADINKDSKIDSADADLILRYDAGIICGFD